MATATSGNTSGNTTATLIDYTYSKKWQTQPFFKAGDYKTIKWIHRNTGENYATAALLESRDEGVNGTNQEYVVASSATSGIAGSTFYQMQAQIIKP